jgi:heme exporter protein A
VRLSGAGLSAARGGRVVFEDVGFAAEGGDLLAVTGPNGAGKSTLLRLIAGLLRPASGTLSLDPAGEEEIGRLAHYLGHLDGLKPGLGLGDNLGFWAKILGSAGDAAGMALDAVELGHLAGLPVAVLSAGQKRRAAIARLLLAPRLIWLLDEPMTALDAHAVGLLARLIERQRAEGGIVIAATHHDLPVRPSAILAMGGGG